MGCSSSKDAVTTVTHTAHPIKVQDEVVETKKKAQPKKQMVQTHKVTGTDSGEWYHAEGGNFVFAFLHKDWNDKVKASVTKAFTDALRISSAIKKAVEDDTGKGVINGLYIAHQNAIIKAMNSIDGMGETSAVDCNEQGSATAVEINQQFFKSVLAGLNGDVAPMKKFLREEMGNVQAQAQKCQSAENFGTIIGLVSLMPILNVPVITFVYAYLSEEEKEWFVNMNCENDAQYAYDYKYSTVTCNYVKP